MPNGIEKLIDSLFLEPYGIDDCMELGRILNNKGIDLKEDVDIYDTITDEKTKKSEKVKKTIGEKESLNLYVSYKGDYTAHYRLHSNTAIAILDCFIKNAEERGKKEYLENKLVSFFKSYEWETWAWKYADAENGSNSSPYNAQKKRCKKMKRK